MELSRTFKDGLDREWTIEISLASGRRMREVAGISIEQLAPDLSGNAKSQQEALEPALLFLGDPSRAFEAFYGLVKPAADARGLSKDQVLEGFPDEAPVERMVQALLGAVAHFFRKSPQRQGTVRLMARHFEAFAQKMTSRVNGAIDKLDIGNALDGLPEIDAAQLNAQLADRLKSGLTDSADTPGSTPKLTPSAS